MNASRSSCSRIGAFCASTMRLRAVSTRGRSEGSTTEGSIFAKSRFLSSSACTRRRRLMSSSECFSSCARARATSCGVIAARCAPVFGGTAATAGTLVVTGGRCAEPNIGVGPCDGSAGIEAGIGIACGTADGVPRGGVSGSTCAALAKGRSLWPGRPTVTRNGPIVKCVP